MGFTVKNTREAGDAAEFISSAILDKLQSGKNVLFFISGGSCIPVAVQAAKIISRQANKNLTVMLADERYGSIDHFNSNYFQLMEKGFSLPNAKLVPILTGYDRDTTSQKFNKNLEEELKKADYKIGLFGIGADGHTAGILPDSVAAHSQDLACSYDTPVFSRITITPKMIEKLDEAVVWAQGEDKWRALKNLLASPVDELRPREKDIPARNAFSIADAGGDILKQPTQILKKVPLLTIFTDYKKI